MGYYSDLLKKSQGQQESLALNPPPSSTKSEETGLLPTLRKAQLWADENLSLGNLQKTADEAKRAAPSWAKPLVAPATDLFSKSVDAAALGGRALGALAVGAFQPSNISQAIPASEASGEAVKQFTAVDVGSAIPGPLGAAIGLADVGLGAGQVYGAISEDDRPLPERLVEGGMGALRTLGGAAGAAYSGAKPKVAAAVDNAATQQLGFHTGKPQISTTPLNPKALNAIDFMGNQALKAINETIAKGGFEGAFPGETPFTPVQRVVVDVNLPGVAQVQGDTITIGNVGVRTLLGSAGDARGIMDKLTGWIAHEVQHGTEPGMGAQRIGGALGAGGHATGVPSDDRLMAFTQQFRDYGIKKAVSQHPLIAQAADAVQRTGQLEGSYLANVGADPEGATQPFRDLKLFHDVMETPQTQRPVVPEHRLTARGAEEPNIILEPLAMGEGLLPKKQMLRALTGRQAPHAVTDIVEIPKLHDFLNWARAPRDAKPGLPKTRSLEVLESLDRAFKQGRLVSKAHLQELGNIKDGELWPIYNDVYQHIRNKLGGFTKVEGGPSVPATPEGKAVWSQLKTVVAHSPRLFAQNARALGTNPRQGGMTARAVTPQKFEEPTTPFEADSNRRVQEQGLRRELIKEGNKPPAKGAAPEEVGNWLQRMTQRVKELVGFARKLDKPSLERMAQADKVSMKELRERRRLAKLAKKPDDVLEIGRGFIEEGGVEREIPGRAELEARLEAEAAESAAKPKFRENLTAPPRRKAAKAKAKKLERSGLGQRFSPASAETQAKLARVARQGAVAEDEAARAFRSEELKRKIAAGMEREPSEPRPVYTGPTLRNLPEDKPTIRPITAEEAATAKKAEPTKYHSTEAMEPLRRKLETAEPMKSAEAGAASDEQATSRVLRLLDQGARVTPQTLDKVGFTPAGKLMAKAALARANKPFAGKVRDAEQVAERFMLQLQLLRQRAEFPKGLVEKGSKRPLMKEAVARLPEGKMSPFAERKGAALPRKEATKSTLYWADELGNVVEEQLRKGSKAAKELSEELGLSIKEKQLAPATVVDPLTGKVSSPSKLTSKLLTSKKLLPKVVDSLKKAIAEGQAAGKDVSKVRAVLQKIETSELYQQTTAPGSPVRFERLRVPRTTKTGKPSLEKLPSTLNPLTSEAQLGSGRPGAKDVTAMAERAAAGKPTIRGQSQSFDIAAHYGQKYSGPTKGVLGEKFVAKPQEGAKPGAPEKVRVPVTAESVKAKRKYVETETKAGMEKLQGHIDELAAKGFLRNLAEAKAQKGYDYPNLLEDYLDGKKIDPDDKYLLVRKDLAGFEKKLAAKYADEWDQLQYEAEEGRLEFRSAQKKKAAAFDEAPLPKETQAWLKSQTTPRMLGGGKTPGIVEWVNQRIALGDLKPTEREGAITFLRTKGQAMERFAARGVSPTQRKAYLAKGAKGDLAERVTLMSEAEDTSPNPWDQDILEIGKGFTDREVEALRDFTKASNKGRTKEQMLSPSERRSAKLQENVGEALNFSRPLVTAVDVSNPFRQTIQLTTDQLTQDLMKVIKKDPQSDTTLAGNIWRMLKSFKSEDFYQGKMKAMKADPWVKLAEEHGLNFIYEGGQQHESWVGHKALSAALNKVPVAGKVLQWPIDASKRAFTYYQNKVMRDAFKYGAEYMRYLHETDPKTYKFGKGDLDDLAVHVNNAASRGKVTNSEEWNKRLNYVFYSAQMNMSRARMLKNVLTGFSTYGSRTSQIYAARQFTRAVAGAAAASGFVYSVASLLGEKPEVEKNPLSTDFGKVNIGDVTYDGGGGWFQFVRAAAQVATGKEKERGTGVIKPKSMKDTIFNFFRSKLGPGATLVADSLNRRTVEGEAVDFEKDPVDAFTTLAWNFVTPMSVDDMKDIVTENPRASWLIPLMLLGNGVSTNLGPGVENWRTTEPLRMSERENRAELKKQGVYPPSLGTKVTLPGRDSAGRALYYNLTPKEREEFEKEYMPLATQLLNEFIRSEAYQKTPDDKKRRKLYAKVHQLNKKYGVASRGRKPFREKFKAGEIEASNKEREE